MNSPEPPKAAQPELTATQYAILAEAQRKKRALAETRIKYNVLVEENKRLLEEREATERTTYEVPFSCNPRSVGNVHVSHSSCDL